MSEPGTVDGRSSPRVRAGVAVALAIAALVLHLLLAFTFQSAGVFEARDVLFDADLNTRLGAFSNWRHLGIKHPNLMAYTSPPVTLAAKSMRAVGLVETPEPQLRRQIAMWIVPVASAIETAIIFVIFARLGVGLWRSLLLTSLALVSFSSLIYGSVPESYGLTALGMALAFLLATTRDEDARGFRYYGAWVLVGVFATGVTISNVAFVGVVLWAKEVLTERQWLRATVRASAVVVLIFGITGVSAYVLDRLMVSPENRPVRTQQQPASGEAGVGSPSNTIVGRSVGLAAEEFGKYVDEKPLHRLSRFPTSVVQTFAPQELGIDDNITRGPFHFAFTFEHTPRAPRFSDPLGLVLLALMIVGTVMAARAEPLWRVVALGSLGILGGSWLMSVWGREAYLYSQTWHLAAVILIALVIRGTHLRNAKTALLVVLNVAIAVTSAIALAEILELVRAA